MAVPQGIYLLQQPAYAFRFLPAQALAMAQVWSIDLAGRTSELGDKTFGVAIFKAPDEDAARKFMQDDPAVAGGLMTVELHPFPIALQRKNP